MPTRKEIRDAIEADLQPLGCDIDQHRPRPYESKQLANNSFINIRTLDEDRVTGKGMALKGDRKSLNVEIEIYSRNINDNDDLTDAAELALESATADVHNFIYSGSEFDSEYNAETKLYLRTLTYTIEYCR